MTAPDPFAVERTYAADLTVDEALEDCRTAGQARDALLSLAGVVGGRLAHVMGVSGAAQTYRNIAAQLERGGMA